MLSLCFRTTVTHSWWSIFVTVLDSSPWSEAGFLLLIIIVPIHEITKTQSKEESIMPCINLFFSLSLFIVASDFEVGECWGYNRFFRLDLLVGLTYQWLICASIQTVHYLSVTCPRQGWLIIFMYIIVCFEHNVTLLMMIKIFSREVKAT